jgi:lysophospholipase L1-like esterase
LRFYAPAAVATPDAVEAMREIRLQTESRAPDRDPDALDAVTLDAQQGEIAAELGLPPVPMVDAVVEAADFTYTMQTDHAGFTNAEPWPSRVDIAVLGDSLLAGAGVGLEGQFTTLLDRRLEDRTVLNLGLPGGGTEQQYRVYRRYAEPLRPELVIAVVWVVWDIENTLRFDRWLAEKPGIDYDTYRRSYGQARPRPRSSGWELAKGRLGRSHLLRAARDLLRPSPPSRLAGRFAFPNGDEVLLSTREQWRLANGFERPDTPNLREVFVRPLERLRTEVEGNGGRFVVALVPSKEELYGAASFPEVLRAIQEVKPELEARGLPVLDLYPTFRARGMESAPYYRLDMHLNELGNRLVADELEKWILEENVFGAAPAERLGLDGASR